MRRLAAVIAGLALLGAPAAAGAKGFGGGGFKSSSGGFKSSSPKSGGGSIKSATGQSVPKTSSAGAKAYSTSKSSLKQPSSGPVKQPAPVTRLIPPTPARVTIGTGPGQARPGSFASKFGVPAGRDYGRDRTTILTHREFANPYYGGYMGSWNSPLLYMYYGSLIDGDGHNNMPPPQADEGEIALILPTEFKVIAEGLK